MPGKESLVAEIRTIVDLGKDWQYESNTETLGLAYAFRPTSTTRGVAGANTWRSLCPHLLLAVWLP